MLHKLKKPNGEFGIFAGKFIPAGQLVFSSKDWVSDEQKGWNLLTLDELERLDTQRKDKFLRYGYDKDYGLIIGTFDWENATHISNFINHSCAPNTRYDTDDNIVAYRNINEGEELTLDYGTFIVNVDQSFDCHCQTPDCRGRITKNDWKILADRYKLNFPTFMHREIETYLACENQMSMSN